MPELAHERQLTSTVGRAANGRASAAAVCHSKSGAIHMNGRFGGLNVVVSRVFILGREEWKNVHKNTFFPPKIRFRPS